MKLYSFRVLPDGSLPPGAADIFKNYASQSLRVGIQDITNNRSLSQNAYYWGFVVEPIRKKLVEHGNEVDDLDVHEYLKSEVGKIKKNVVFPDGEIKEFCSSKRLSKEEFSDYIVKIIAWAEQWEIDIPLPEQARNLYNRVAQPPPPPSSG